ncbi:MAG: phosphoribosylglycinamide formyltransferase [Elusimicrobia bacterium]|nr:phosphoribosylglycinamide formyltransferase [Elusimicrobiota bacterium]
MPEAELGIGVLASGGGSNFESLARACRDARIPGAAVRLLIVNKAGVGALDRAARLGIEAMVLSPKDFATREVYFERIARELESRGVRLVCLAGFLLKVEPLLVHRFPGRMVNIHPALLPKYGGRGMFGHHVHEAVLNAGDAESGCTVHGVDEEFDHGPVLAQARVPVLPGDTAETLAARVLKEEHRIYPEAVRDLVLRLKKEIA